MSHRDSIYTPKAALKLEGAGEKGEEQWMID